MSLEKLLNKIKEDAEKEKESLKKKSGLEMEKMDKEGEKRIDFLRQEKEKDLAEERKKMLVDYRKEKTFEMNMKLLELRRDLMEESIFKVKEKVSGLPALEKKDLLKKGLKKVEGRIGRDCLVSVPSGKKQELADIFKEFSDKEVMEKDIGFSDGFSIETDKIVFKASLSGFIDEAIEKEKDFFSRLLFKQ